MGLNPRISLENRAKMVVLAEEGYSQTAISLKVGCCRGSVYLILKKFRETGGVKDRKIPGRPRKKTAR